MSLNVFHKGHSILLRSFVGPSNFIAERCVHHHMERGDLERFIGIHRSSKTRANRNTHINEKAFRAARGRKFVPIELPDYEVEKKIKAGELTPTEIRSALLRQGINPGKDFSDRKWEEQQMSFQSFYGVVEPNVLPENYFWSEPRENQEDGKGVMDNVKTRVKDRALNMYKSYFTGSRRINKKKGMNFKSSTFPELANSIYEQAFTALAERNKDELINRITEYAYAKLWPDVEKGSMVWKLCEFVEPSKVVAVRCGDYPQDSGNDIAQVTVRMHTEQIFALYDRFGKLLLGSPTEPKRSVEYVVFENHVASSDGKWRLHDKIYPKWLPKKSGFHELEKTKEPQQIEAPQNSEEVQQSAQG
ncbi:Tim44 domain-containing protein [Aphelenchoides besseyi]|nr:Tim44 domain-containing protein [Aphelenchoides besseyi]